MKPEHVRCLRICGLHMSRGDFAAAVGVRQHAANFWQRSTKYSNPPADRYLLTLSKLAREARWAPTECTGVCGREAERVAQPDNIVRWSYTTSSPLSEGSVEPNGWSGPDPVTGLYNLQHIDQYDL